MKILVINCGSSSIKYSLFQMPNQNNLAKGSIERIGQKNSIFNYKHQDISYESETGIDNYQHALSLILEALIDKKNGAITKKEQIDATGHRVVHGGNIFTEPVIIDKTVISSIKKLIPLAPLHNAPGLAGIEAVQKLLSKVPHIACFDTVFHRTIPDHAFIYGLPYELYEKYGIRKYGFHGISNQFVTERVFKLSGKSYDLNMVICHLGSGCSITAVENGHSIDTSMGFTPMEGVVMGTRPGDFDPAIIFYLQSKGYSPNELNDMFNKSSGLIGISGSSNDIRDLLQAEQNGDERAKLALEIFCYRIKKYIGAYMAVLGRLDVLVFTGGIGENSYRVRERSCENLEQLGIEIDKNRNQHNSKAEREISSLKSLVKIYVIPTDEELVIASNCFELIKKSEN